MAASTQPRPAAVAFDLPRHVPQLTTTQKSTGSVVALAQPEASARVTDLLDLFFSAVTREDLGALSGLLTSDAEVIGARGAKARPIEHWARRSERLDYTGLFPSLIYSRHRVEIHEARALDEETAGVQGLLLRAGEVLVRVPIAPTLGNSKLFGGVIEMVLSDADGGYKIRVFREDFELPETR